MIYTVIIVAALDIFIFVVVAWSRCPKGIVRALFDRRRSEKRCGAKNFSQ